MSSQPETAADKSSDTPSTDKATTETIPTPQTKPIKKVKSKKDLKDDPSRFEAPGINFNAKLIGIDEVESARGDKMCQDAMTRLKTAVRQSGQHKQKIILNVSLEGIRIMDLRTTATNHTHPVHRISFISRDITDARAFGYVYGAGEGKHKFYAIKTEKQAEALVLSLRDLFQAVYEKKKKEVEDAKHKIEEPAEKAEEAKESQEPVYQVPSSKPVENGEDPTYQVPTSNAPVKQESAPDLLNLENELHSMEQRIEQIDTMEELFKELEAPPPATSGTASSDSSSASWASSLAGLAPPQPQSQPMFSMGGSPFPPPANQPFPPANQPFGAPAQQQPMFGVAPGQQQQQPFGFPQAGAQPAGGPFGGPFQQPPSVPPRTGGGFPAAQPGVFPGTPFPGTMPQQPGFPPVGANPMGGPQPSVVVTPANDPFGSEPFGGNSAFEEGVLMPAKLENPEEEDTSAKPQQPDVFGDLVSLGGASKQMKSPKEMFLEDKPKKSLNQMKGDGSTSPKPPASPTGFQASGSPGELEIGYSSPSNVPPEQSSSKPFSTPFGADDPFANDPFASKTSSTSTAPSTDAWTPATPGTAQAQHNPSHDAQFGGSPFGDDDFNLPVPSGPPPPLPSDVCERTTVEPQLGPAIPPRPAITPPMNTRPIPPTLPPRPKSNSSESIASSVSSTNSYSESQLAQKQETPPPPPPRPKSQATTVPVPRPRPRPRASIATPDKTQHAADKTAKVNNNYIVNSVDTQTNVTTPSVSAGNDRTNVDSKSERVTQAALKSSAIKNAQTDVTETHRQRTTDSSVTRKSQSEKNSGDIRPVSSGSSISDPFTETDPFASEDPFKHSDPFANDPFAADPFSDPIFTPPQPASANDPFTSVLPSPKSSTDDSDPFSVFDKTFSSDMYKFDRSSSKKSKLKVSGQ